MKTFKHHGIEYIEIADNLYALASERRMPPGKRHHFMRGVSLLGKDIRYRMFPVPQGGSLQTWQEVLVSGQVDGNSLSNTTTATSIIPPASRYTLPANYFSNIGKALRVGLAGRISNIVTTPGTLTLDVRMGPTSNIIVFNGGAMQLSTTAHTTLPFIVEILLTCRAIGSGTSANLMGQGIASSQTISLTAVADSTTSVSTLMLPNTTPAVGTGFDSTVSMVVDVFAAFSIANAANLIQVHQYVLESLN